MLSYIIRRLLLIIPTMLGITFLIFMLVAYSPGGVGAALQAASGQMEQTDRAKQEAYLEERYGLNDPPPIQYLRWLSRVSPIKFGTRSQVRENGEFIHPPKPIELPILAGEWYAIGHVPPAPSPVPAYSFTDAPITVPTPQPGSESAAAPGTLRWLVPNAADIAQGRLLAEVVPAQGPATPIRAARAGILRRTAADGAPAAPGAAIGVIEEKRETTYNSFNDRFVRARAEYIAARASLEDAIRLYANWGADLIRMSNDSERRLRERRALLADPGAMPADQIASLQAEIAELEARILPPELLAEAQAHRDRFLGSVTDDNKLRAARLRRAGLDTSHPLAPAVVAAGERALAALTAAQSERENLLSVYRARPFRQAGFWIIPGYVSVASPDLGVSFSTGTSVVSKIGDALPVTLLLNVIAFPIIYMLAVPTGLLAAVKKGKLFDHLSGAMVVGLWSIPVLVASVLMLGFLASRNGILGDNHFPVGFDPRNADAMLFLPSRDDDGSWQPGMLLAKMHHMVLPLIALIYPGLAILTKQTRAAMLDNFSADYVRTAKAKGVSAKDVVFRHVLRNSLLPLITMFATIFPAMLSGAIIVERVFTINGMGSLIIESINLRDRELLLANVMMITCVNLLALLLADILYAVADPRISYS